MNKILILAPHPDDGEIGCGGTINKLIAAGNVVYYIAVADCNKSLPEEFPPGTLREESANATRILGIKPEHMSFLDYEVRELPKYRQEILEDFVKINRAINPDFVFMPCSYDTHQDHATVHQEGFRAFKNAMIFGYEIPWNCITFKANCFSPLNDRQLTKKEMAISEYHSQRGRPYMTDFVRPHARTRGLQSNNQYAEAFEVVRIRI